jgi:hypothetical protein
MVKENYGRGDVGSVNFTIRVPYEASVDIETKGRKFECQQCSRSFGSREDLNQRRHYAYQYRRPRVSADNGIGNIFFDGDLQPNGNYRFTSFSGDINLRVPFNSSFKLIATAPSTRSINLGSFASENMRFVGDGRRVTGQAGDGSSYITVMNQRGSIAFIRRYELIKVVDRRSARDLL